MRKLLLLLLALGLIDARADPIGNTLSPPVMSGAGSPEGVVTGTVGTVYRDTSGGVATTFYVKESGSGNTGWVAYGSPSGTGAPSTATYIVQTANGSLSAEQALSTLANGFVFVTNGTGALSSFTIQSQAANLEAVMSLQNLQGAVTDAQVPNDITLTLSTYKTGLEAILELQNLQGSLTDAQIANNITIDVASQAVTLATPRTIGGVSFDGSINIVPQTIQVVDTTSSVTYPSLFDSASGNLQPKTDPGISYDATTGVLITDLFFQDTNSNYAAVTTNEAIDELSDVDGNGPNSTTAKVDWSQIGGMPTAFADGTDDGGGGGGGADADALHDNVSGEIALISEKTLPVGTDLAVIEDSASSNAKKRIQLANLETLLEAVMDLQQMQGAVTDAQVPDTITVQQSMTGDSATAFFTSGQIERARGGTGVDTSAYGASLFGSNASNVTIAVTTMGGLETAIGGANIIQSTELDTVAEVNTLIGDGNFVPESRSLTILGTTGEVSLSAGLQDLTTDRSWTISLPAVIDLGGKTSFEVPNSAAPTVDAFGELAGDSNLWGTGRGAPVFFDGTSSVALIGTLVSDTPTDGQIPVFHSSNGTTTWESFTTTAGGSDTELQYNNLGAMDGTNGLNWNNVTDTLSVGTFDVTAINADSLRILDNVDQSHAMVIVANENLVADINLLVDLDGSTRTLNIPGNAVISGTNTGDQTIILSGDVTGTGTGSIVSTIADSVAVSSWSLTTPSILGIATWEDNVRQTFNPGVSTPGLNVGGYTGDPSTPSNGDLWYDSTGNLLRARINGASVTLGTGGAGGAPDSVDYLVGTANGTLSAEIVVGTTPGGELGGTWAAPTLDDSVTVTGWELGASTATTAIANDNDTSLATTAYVQAELVAYNSDTITFTNKTDSNGVAAFSVPGVDDTAAGELITGLTNSGGVTQWDVVYLNSSSQWVLADANGINTYPSRGLATTTVAAAGTTSVIVRGIVRNDAWAWTPGQTIWLSTTAGALTQTQPNTSADKVQAVGYALTADVMMVNISPDYGTIP